MKELKLIWILLLFMFNLSCTVNQLKTEQSKNTLSQYNKSVFTIVQSFDLNLCKKKKLADNSNSNGISDSNFDCSIIEKDETKINYMIFAVKNVNKDTFFLTSSSFCSEKTKVIVKDKIGNMICLIQSRKMFLTDLPVEENRIKILKIDHINNMCLFSISNLRIPPVKLASISSKKNDNVKLTNTFGPSKTLYDFHAKYLFSEYVNNIKQYVSVFTSAFLSQVGAPILNSNYELVSFVSLLVEEKTQKYIVGPTLTNIRNFLEE